MKKCINCGIEIKDEAKFCDECGAAQLSQSTELVSQTASHEKRKK